MIYVYNRQQNTGRHSATATFISEQCPFLFEYAYVPYGPHIALTSELWQSGSVLKRISLRFLEFPLQIIPRIWIVLWSIHYSYYYHLGFSRQQSFPCIIHALPFANKLLNQRIGKCNYITDSLPQMWIPVVASVRIIAPNRVLDSFQISAVAVMDFLTSAYKN